MLQADALVAVGVVELHQYAGFSGGHKAVVVGCGSQEGIRALHHRDFLCQPGVLVGQLHDNPFRAHIDRVGQMLPPCTALQYIHKKGWLAGEAASTLQQAASFCDPFFDVTTKAQSAILRNPESKAVNFYQASRAATYLALSPRPPLEKGARVIVEAACPEGLGLGLGEQACAEALSSCSPPWSELLDGPFEFGGGAQRAVMIARLSRHYELIVAGCDKPDALRKLGIQATSDSAESLTRGTVLRVQQPFVQLPQFSGSSITY